MGAEDLESLIAELEEPIEVSGEGANITGYPCIVANFVLGIIFPSC